MENKLNIQSVTEIEARVVVIRPINSLWIKLDEDISPNSGYGQLMAEFEDSGDYTNFININIPDSNKLNHIGYFCFDGVCRCFSTPKGLLVSGEMIFPEELSTVRASSFLNELDVVSQTPLYRSEEAQSYVLHDAVLGDNEINEYSSEVLINEFELFEVSFKSESLGVEGEGLYFKSMENGSV